MTTPVGLRIGWESLETFIRDEFFFSKPFFSLSALACGRDLEEEKTTCPMYVARIFMVGYQW